MPEQEQSDPIETAFFAAELSSVPSVDLHGLDLDLAINALDKFLNSEFIAEPRRDVKIVKVIHGRGNGILQKMVTDYLNNSRRFVAKYRTSNDPKQANGVTLVALSPNKK